MNNCNVCNSLSIDPDDIRFDDRYGYSGVFTLMRCQACGHIFLQHDFTPDQLTDLYSNYYPRSNFDLDAYYPHRGKKGLLAWLDGAKSSAFRWVPKNVRVLDVGCGFGESLGYHAARGCEVFGVEADKNIRRVAEKYGFNVHVGLFDPDVYEENFFDYVTLDQVLEHVTDPMLALQGVAKIMKPGGTAVVSFPNANGWGAKLFGRKWINWHTPYHLQFYSEKSLKILADKVGLVIVDDRTITPSAWLHYQWLHLLTCPQPGEPSKFWAGMACGKKRQFPIFKTLLMIFISVIHRLKFNHLITRIFDNLGLGDNRILILKKP